MNLLYLLPSVLFFIRTVLADDACTPRTESGRAATVHAGPLLRRPGVLEPVHDVVRVQWLPAAARLQGVQFRDVVLDLFARRMLILSEPALKARQFELGVEAGPHPRLVRILQERWMRWTDRTTARRDRATAIGLRALRVMMMVIRGRPYRVHTETDLLLLQPSFEISFRLLRQIVATSAEG